MTCIMTGRSRTGWGKAAPQLLPRGTFWVNIQTITHSNQTSVWIKQNEV